MAAPTPTQAVPEKKRKRTGGRTTSHPRRAERLERAGNRRVEAEGRTPAEQLARLDERAVDAVRERARLQVLLGGGGAR